MQLSINRTNLDAPVMVQPKDESAFVPVEYNHPYQIDDQGHTAIVRQLGRDVLRIDVKNGRQFVRFERVELLSSIVGRDAKGNSTASPCVLEVSADKPAFPIAELVAKLLGHGLHRWQITPLNCTEFTENSVSHSSPHMISDGAVTRSDLPSTRKLMASTDFTVDDWAWAIMFHGDKISHVYLRVATTENTEDVMSAIYLIESGIYVA